MYITTFVTLEDCEGNEADYEVGADVYQEDGHIVVDEPDISAAGMTLEEALLWPDPQGGDVLQDGWSDIVELALADEYETQF